METGYLCAHDGSVDLSGDASLFCGCAVDGRVDGKRRMIWSNGGGNEVSANRKDYWKNLGQY